MARLFFVGLVMLLAFNCVRSQPGFYRAPKKFSKAPVVLRAFLDADQEPQGVDPDTPADAQGVAVFVLQPDQRLVRFNVVYSGLSGDLAAAHFHMGELGVNGPVVQTICGAPAPALLGDCPKGKNFGLLTGTYAIPERDLSTLLSGGIYVNLHTALNPAGEIRGQIKLKH